MCHQCGLKKYTALCCSGLPWPPVVFDSCENCRPILGRVQRWDQTCYCAKRVLGGPVTLLWSALEVQSRNAGRYPEDEASVAVVVLNWDRLQPARGGVCPGACWSQSAQMFRNNFELWDKVFYRFVSFASATPVKLPFVLFFSSSKGDMPTALLTCKWNILLSFHLLAENQGRKSSIPAFFWSATEEFNHKSAHTGRCSQLLEEGTCKTVLLFCKMTGSKAWCWVAESQTQDCSDLNEGFSVAL